MSILENVRKRRRKKKKEIFPDKFVVTLTLAIATVSYRIQKSKSWTAHDFFSKKTARARPGGFMLLEFVHRISERSRGAMTTRRPASARCCAAFLPRDIRMSWVTVAPTPLRMASQGEVVRLRRSSE